jgi:hypothetical protein
MPAFAQNQPYDTPLYTTQPPAALDKNFGLPSFGMRGAEQPQQRTMAPEPEPLEKPDFFKGSSDFTRPRARALTSAGSAMETPLYTTNEGSTTGGGMSGGFTTGEPAANGLTTGEVTTGGFTTGDSTTPPGGAAR